MSYAPHRARDTERVYSSLRRTTGGGAIVFDPEEVELEEARAGVTLCSALELCDERRLM